MLFCQEGFEAMTLRSAGQEVEVRELRIEDYDAVQRLWTEAGLPFRPQGRDRPEKVAVELERGTGILLGAEVEGRLAGVVLGTHDGRKGWINRLAVAPAYRRQGIARRLVGEVESRLEALGLDVTAALIESYNQESLGLFKALGYRHTPEVDYVSKRRSEAT